MNIRINAEFLAGTDVRVAADEAVALANWIGVAIKYNFKGVTCIANPGDNAESLAERCMAQVGSTATGKFARGEPERQSDAADR